MGDVITFDRNKQSGRTEDGKSCWVNFVWETNLGEDAIESLPAKENQHSAVIELVRDRGGVDLMSDDGRHFFFPWPPTYIEIEYPDGEDQDLD